MNERNFIVWVRAYAESLANSQTLPMVGLQTGLRVIARAATEQLEGSNDPYGPRYMTDAFTGQRVHAAEHARRYLVNE